MELNLRTDLAVEAFETSGGASASKLREIEGVSVKTEQIRGMSLTKVEITGENGSECLGKPMGKYVTLQAEEFTRGGVKQQQDLITTIS